MDVATALWLTSIEGRTALAGMAAAADPESLATATRLRAEHSPDRAAALATQEILRRRAAAPGGKFGRAGRDLFFTPAGLEAATRPAVAAWRAGRFVAAGVHEVVDLGCGIGADAMAFIRAGLTVTAVELDPVTAILAQANLDHAAGQRAESDPASPVVAPRVINGDAELLAADLLTPGGAVFCDPSRRTAQGRTWNIADFQPSWDIVTTLLDGSRVACVKMGPGLPHGLIPDGVSAIWVSEHGDVVEAGLWAGFGPDQPRRAAMLVDADALLAADVGEPEVRGLGAYLYEPDGAVIRAGAVGRLARELRAWRVVDQVAYLASDTATTTVFATCFAVLEVLPYDLPGLKAWVRDNDIGILEIKKRGLDVDPALLRKRLRPRGRKAATVILTPTPDGARALVCRRVADRRGG